MSRVEILTRLRDAAVDPPVGASTREVLAAGAALVAVRAPLLHALERATDASQPLDARERALVAEIRTLDGAWNVALGEAYAALEAQRAGGARSLKVR